jgi:hypothetical protein
MWPFFMEQERGATSIADAWKALEGKVSVADMNAAISSPLPFKAAFRDFAVRALNRTLDPGVPIKPRFSEQDGAVSTATPGERRTRPEIALAPGQGKTLVNETLPSLWASYTKMTVDPLVRKVTLDFAALLPADALDVDVLLKIKDKGWERRKLGTGRTTLCRINKADDVEELWLVLSNHATPEIRVKCQLLGEIKVFDKSNELDEMLGWLNRFAQSDRGAVASRS